MVSTSLTVRAFALIAAALGVVASPVESANADLTCANVRCAAGTTCVMVGKRPVCKPNPVGEVCGPTVCNVGDVCCNALCGICTAPGMMCIQGCEVKETPAPSIGAVAVAAAAAAPVATAPSSGSRVCGPSICKQGEVCCNESCGICTPPDGVCTQQICPRSGPTCGPNVCNFGDVCCNESCGICSPPGGSCTQQFCTGSSS